MAKYNQIIDLTAKVLADEKSKQELKKEMLDLLDGLRVEVDEDKFKEEIKDIAKAMNVMLANIGKSIDIDELINMKSLDAMAKLGEIAGNDFIDAFNSSLKGANNIQMQQVIEELRDIQKAVNKIASSGTGIKLFDDEQLAGIVSQLQTGIPAAAKTAAKGVRELDEAISRLESKNGQKNPYETIRNTLGNKNILYKTKENVESYARSYSQSKDGQNWEEYYQKAIKFVVSYDKYFSKLSDSDQVTFKNENQELVEQYDSVSKQVDSMRVSLTNLLDRKAGAFVSEEQLATERTLKNLVDALTKHTGNKETENNDQTSEQHNTPNNTGLDNINDIINRLKNIVFQVKEVGGPDTRGSKVEATMYHGTSAALNNADVDISKLRQSSLGHALYYTPQLEKAAAYGKNIVKTEFQLDRVFVLAKDFITDVDALYQAMDQVAPENANWEQITKDLNDFVIKNSEKFAQNMLKLGYQGMLSKGYNNADPNFEQLAIYDSQYYKHLTTKPYDDIKSAAPTEVTSVVSAIQSGLKSGVSIDTNALRNLLESIVFKVASSDENDKAKNKRDISEIEEDIRQVESDIEQNNRLKDNPSVLQVIRNKNSRLFEENNQKLIQLRQELDAAKGQTKNDDAGSNDLESLVNKLVEALKSVIPNTESGQKPQTEPFAKNINDSKDETSKDDNIKTVKIDSEQLGELKGNAYTVKLEDDQKTAKQDDILSNDGEPNIQSDPHESMRTAIQQELSKYGTFDEAKRAGSGMIKYKGEEVHFGTLVSEYFSQALGKSFNSNDFKDIWKEAREKYYTFTPKEMDKYDAIDILQNKLPENILEGWFRKGDSPYKAKLEEAVMSDEEIRNAALNIMWSNFKEFSGKDIGFDEFLHSDIPVYRGKNSEKYVDGDELLSFTFDRKVAEKFGKYVLETIIKPIDTLGAFQTTGETETLVYREHLESKPEYQQWHDDMSGKIQKETAAIKEKTEALNEELIKKQQIEKSDDSKSEVAEIKEETAALNNHNIAQEKNNKLKLEEKFTTDDGNANLGASDEKKSLDLLKDKLDDIIAAVRLKTEEFENEQDTVSLTVEQEIKDLNSLLSKITDIKNTCDSLFTDANLDGFGNIEEDLKEFQKTLDTVMKPITDNDFEMSAKTVSDFVKEINNNLSPLKEILENINSLFTNIKADGKDIIPTSGEITVNVKYPEEKNDGLKQTTHTKQSWAKESTLRKTRGTLKQVEVNTKNIADAIKNLKLGSSDTNEKDSLIIETLKNINSQLEQREEKKEDPSEQEAKQRRLDINRLKRQAEQVGQYDAIYKVSGNIEAKERSEQLQKKIVLEVGRLQLNSDQTTLDEIKEKYNDSYAYNYSISNASEEEKQRIKKIHEEEQNRVKTLKEINRLYEKLADYQAHREFAGADDNQNSVAEFDKLIEDTYKEISNKKKSIKITEQDSKRFTDTFNKKKKESDEKLSKLGQDKRESNFVNLSKEIEKLAKLQAKFDATQDNVVAAELEKQKQIVEEKKKTLKLTQLTNEEEAELNKIKNDTYNKELLTQQAKQAKKDDKILLKQKRKEARINKAESVWQKGKNTLLELWRLEGVSDKELENIPGVKELSNELNGLGLVISEINNKGLDILDDDKKKLQEATIEVLKYETKIKDLIKNYEQFSDEISTEESIRLNKVFDPNQDVKSQLKAFIDELTDGKAKIKEIDEVTKTAIYTLSTGTGELTEFTVGVRNADKVLRAVPGTTKKVETFLESITRKAKEVLTYFSGSTLIYKAFEELRRGIQYVREIDAALTELKKVTDETDETYRRFLKTASQTAGKVGATIAEVVNSTADWARLGYAIEDAANLAESTSILLNVSEFNSIDSATSSLVSTMQAFGYAAKDSMYVVDVMNEIGNNYAVSSDGIATALQDSASALMTANNSYEEAVAMVAAANRVVQNPSEVGGALRTISLRLRGTKVSELEAMGEDTTGAVETKSKLRAQLKGLTGVDILTDTGAYKSTYEILLEISKVWNTLTDEKRAGALELISGKNRANVASALLSNTKDLEKAYESAMNADGSALRENERYLDSIQGKLDQFANAYQTFWNNLINSDFIKDIVDLGTNILKAASNFGELNTAVFLLITYFTIIKKMKVFGGEGFKAPENGLFDIKTLKTLQKVFSNIFGGKNSIDKQINKLQKARQEALVLRKDESIAIINDIDKQIAVLQKQKETMSSSKNTFFTDMLNNLKAAGKNILEWLNKLQSNASGFISKTIDGAKGKFSSLANNIKRIYLKATNQAFYTDDSGKVHRTGVKDVRLDTQDGLNEKSYSRLRETIAKIQIDLKNVVRNGKSMFSELTASAQYSFNKLKDHIGNTFKGVLNNISSGFKTTINSVSTAFKKIFKHTKENTGVISPDYMSKTQKVIAGINRIWNNHVVRLKKSFDSVQDKYTRIWNNHKIRVKDSIKYASEQFDKLKDAAKKKFNSIETFAAKVGIVIKNIFAKIPNVAKSLFSGIKTKAGTVFKDFGFKINPKSLKVLQQQINNVQLQLNDAKDTAAKMFYEHGTKADYSKINERIRNLTMQLDALKAKYNKATTSILDKFSISFNKLTNAFKQKFGGIINSMGSGFTKLFAKIKTKGVAVFKAIAGVASQIVVNLGYAMLMEAIMEVGRGIKELFSKLDKSAEAAQEKFEQLNSELSDCTSELDSLNSELETTQERIDELMASGSLSFAEQEELDLLRKQNAELEQKIKLNETLQKTLQQGVNSAAITATDKYMDQTSFFADDTKSERQEETSKKWKNALTILGGIAGAVIAIAGVVAAAPSGGASLALTQAGGSILAATATGSFIAGTAGDLIGSAVGGASYKNEQTVSEAIENMQSERASLIKARDEAYEAHLKDTSDEELAEKYENAANALSTYDSKMAEHMTRIKQNYNAMTWTEDETTQQTMKWYADTLDAYNILMGTIGAKESAVSRIFGAEASSMLISVKDKAIEAAKAGEEINLESIFPSQEAFDEFRARLYDMGLYVADVERYFEDFAETSSAALDTTDYYEVAKAIDGITDALGSLNSAIEEVNENGILSAKTLTTLNETFGSVESVSNEWNNFVKVMMSATSTTFDMTKATEELAQAWLDEELLNKPMTYAKKMATAAHLTNLGIDNALDVVEDAQKEAGFNKVADAIVNKKNKKTELEGINEEDRTEEQKEELKALTTELDNIGANSDWVQEIANEWGLTNEELQKHIDLLVQLAEKRTQLDAIDSKTTYAEGLLSEVKKINEAQSAYDDMNDKWNTRWAATDSYFGWESFFKNDYSAKDAYNAVTLRSKRTAEGLEAFTKDYNALKSLYQSGGSIDDLLTRKEELEAELEKMDFDPSISEETKQNIQSEIDSINSQIENGLTDEIDLELELRVTLGKVGTEFDNYTSKMETLASIQAEVAKGFIISAEKAREFAAVYPEILANAKTTANGQIQLNSDVVNAFLSGERTELNETLDTEIGKLEAQKATLQAKIIYTEEQLKLAQALAEGESSITQQQFEWKVNAGNAMTTAMINMGIEESKAYAMAAAAMAGNTNEFNKIAAEVCTDVDGNFNQAAYNAAQNIYTNMQNAQGSVAAFAKQCHEAATAMAGVASGKVQGSSNIVGGGSGGTSGSGIKITLHDGTFNGSEYTYTPKEFSLDDYISDLKIDLSEFTDGIDKIDGMIALLESQKNRPLSSFDPNKDSSLNGSEDADGNGVADAEEISDAWEKLLKKYENKLALITNQRDLIQAEIDQMEATGAKASHQYYKDLIDNSNAEKQLLIDKRDELQKYLDANKHLIDQDTWTEMNNEINDVKVAIQECTVNLLEYYDAMEEIDAHYFEQTTDDISRLGEEIQFVQGLLEDKDVADENGNWTNEGITQLGLYVNEMERAAASAELYKKELGNVEESYKQYHKLFENAEDINGDGVLTVEDIDSDKLTELYNKYGYVITSAEEYKEKTDELTDSMYSEIEAYESAKDGIVELNEARVDAIKEGIDKEIEAYEELIELKKEELDAERDLYDFRRNIQKQSKDISSLERRIMALSGSDAAADIAEKKRLEAELYDAKESLSDTFYNHAKDQQAQSLDDEMTAFQDSKDKYIEELEKTLENTEELISNSMMDVLLNADVVHSQLNDIVEKYGITLSQELTQPWANASEQARLWKEKVGAYTGECTPFVVALSDSIKQQLGDGKDNAWSKATNAVQNYVDFLTGKELSDNFSATITGFGTQISGLVTHWNNVKTAADNAYTAIQRASTVGGNNNTGGSDGGNNGDNTTTQPTTTTKTGVNQYDKNVKQLQYALNLLIDEGMIKGNALSTDGVFGAQTRAAVKAAQKISGATVNGVYDSATKAAITKYLDLRIKMSNKEGQDEYSRRMKHIKSQFPSPLPQYAKGTMGTTKDNWAITDEPWLGDELVLVPTASGNLSYMRKGTSVVPAAITENLVEWGKLNPNALNLHGSGVNVNMISNAVNKPEIKLDVENFLRCDNVSQDTLPELKKFVNEQMNSLMRQLNYGLKKSGAR